MSPEARREQILDSAVELIIARGLSSCTLENVAVQAAISKPLIYKYFPRREDLLKAVLEREYRFLRGRGLAQLPRDMTYAEVLRMGTERAIEYLYERGTVMRLLGSDRSVAALAQSRDRDERAAMTKYFADRIRRNYGVPADAALICAIMHINAPILSARPLKRYGIPPKRVAEVWSDFILAGWDAYSKQLRARSAKSTTRKRPKKH